MALTQWHKVYVGHADASPQAVFDLLADLPNYPSWLPSSSAYGGTTDVEPYPVRSGSRYRDGKPDESGKNWWGTVTGYQRPGSLDFHHTIYISAARAVVDTHIHYSFEPDGDATAIQRWLMLSIAIPAPLLPLKKVITSKFDAENLRTMDAVRAHFASNS